MSFDKLVRLTPTRRLNTGSTVSQPDSTSSHSMTPLSTQTRTSMSSSSSTVTPARPKPLVERNGRKYLSDPDLPYPLPVDLCELHRQSLRTLLLTQCYGAPVTCPVLKTRPPRKVLEVGCGSGFWSMMCHQYYQGQGHTGISFTGIDIAPVATKTSGAKTGGVERGPDMDWQFYQFDVTTSPWPFPDESFDLIMNKDMSLAIPLAKHRLFGDEILRVLKKGGVFEVWVTDHMIRRVRPHVPDKTDEQEAALRRGAYSINMSTPFGAPWNPYLAEYNRWLSQAMEARQLTTNPCTSVADHLYQEEEVLYEVGSRRVAIPLSELEWEFRGVGGSVPRYGKASSEPRDRTAQLRELKRSTLSSGQAALRRTALLTLVQEIQAQELLLRPASGKNQDEWDLWIAKMSEDLMNDDGARSGECIESGAWWCRKRWL